MPEALQDPLPTRSAEVPERRPSGGFETSTLSDKKVIDYRNDPRYKKKKMRSVLKDDDGGFMSPKSRADILSAAAGGSYSQEDFEIEYVRSGELPSPSSGFTDQLEKSRILEPCPSGGHSSDGEGQVSPLSKYGATLGQPSFLLPSSELTDEESPNDEVSLKDMFKTIDPTTSPFC